MMTLLDTLTNTLVRHSLLVAATAVLALVVYLVVLPLWLSPLAVVPGPRLFALSRWRLALEDWRGTRTSTLHALHARLGPVVRIGPADVSFASLAALRSIYGAGSGFERTSFYSVFDVYGRPNMFSVGPVRAHADRKKLIAHAYAKSAVLRLDGAAVPLIARHVRGFLALVDRHTRDAAQTAEAAAPLEIFRTLHWFSLDCITGFLYGEAHGGTNALRGREDHRRLLDDILDTAGRRLSWFAFHLPAYTAWLYGLTGWAERLVTALGLLPMAKPTTYSAIRRHALQAWREYDTETREKPDALLNTPAAPIMTRLAGRIDGLDMASELADHLLAGIDTTSDSAMFAIWALSRPEHAAYQARLVAEVMALDADKTNLDEHGNPTADVAARLPFLDAVLRETLRLYAPLPASEPRVLPTTDSVVDGVHLPAGTVVSIDPYTLHRDPTVFPDPLAFRPERWLGDFGDVAEMRRWFWAFSSGGRMCIGMHLAMAEMTMLLSALYRRYTTHLAECQKGASPGTRSRFEIFGDITVPRMTEHECWIEFKPRQTDEYSEKN